MQAELQSVMEEIVQLSGRGGITLPAKVRKQLGLVEGDILTVRVSGRSIVLAPSVLTAVELYDEHRISEFEENSRLTDDELTKAKESWRASISGTSA